MRLRATGAQPVGLVLWRGLHRQNGCVFVIAGMLNLWLGSFPQCHALAVAAPSQGQTFASSVATHHDGSHALLSYLEELLAKTVAPLQFCRSSEHHWWCFISIKVVNSKNQFGTLLFYCYRPQGGDQNGAASLFRNFEVTHQTVASPHSSQDSQWHQCARSRKWMRSSAQILL